MAALATIATIASIASAGLTAVGTIAAGRAQAAEADAQAQLVQQRAQAENLAAEFEAKQIEGQALEEKAQGQQDMLELRRRKNLALSSLQARAAGSGFTATDPTALALAGDITEYGTLQEQMALYGGTSREAGLRSSAAARRFNAASGISAAGLEAGALRQAGRAARTGSYLSAAGTIAGAASTMAAKYAKRPAPSGPLGWRTTVNYG